jgi:hypothetical protein
MNSECLDEVGFAGADGRRPTNARLSRLEAENEQLRRHLGRVNTPSEGQIGFAGADGMGLGNLFVPPTVY